MRVLFWLLAAVCGIGFVAATPEPTASADYCNCGGRQYYAAGRSCVNVCTGNADYGRRWRRGGRRVRYQDDYGSRRGHRRFDSRYAEDLYDIYSTERAINTRDRVAAAAVNEQSWRMWRRPESVYGPPPTAVGPMNSIRFEDLSPDLNGFFCLEGKVIYPKPATPEARAFCSQSTPP